MDSNNPHFSIEAHKYQTKYAYFPYKFLSSQICHICESAKIVRETYFRFNTLGGFMRAYR